MNFQSVDILVHSLRVGDAIGDHTILMGRLLEQQAITTKIVSGGQAGTLPEDIERITQVTNFAEYQPQADLTIIKYGAWYPLVERLTDSNHARLFWYHGVTPPELWQTEVDRAFLEQAEARTQLAWHTHVAVADSPFTADELHRHSGYPRERIRVVPIHIDVTSFQQPPLGLEQLRAQWHLQGKEVLLYVGRIAGNKRIDLLIDALHLLADEAPELHLLIVGDHKAGNAALAIYQRLKEKIDRYGLSNRVTFTGRVPQVEPYYHLADIFVTASQHEGFGVPLLEAMAANVPVVASASGAMPWVLRGNDETAAGLLFHENDEADLARQIQRLRTEPALCQKLQVAGQKRLQDFSASNFQRQTFQVLSEAVECSRQGPPPAATRQTNPFYRYADVALRSYKIISGIPLVGPLIERIRYHSTTHVKEAYLDQIIERQVNFNRLLADEVVRLQNEIQAMQEEVQRLKSQN